MFATRCEEIAPFTVMQLLQRAAELEAEGQRVVHFEIGESDFPTATPILDAATMALKHGRTKYTPAQGIPELRAAISSFYASNGVAVAADRIIVTAGASGGLVLLASLLLNPGDELLITDPGYPCDGVFAHLVGARPRSLPVTASGRFQPTPESIQKAWSDRCAGMLLASPTNPTGTMSSRLELDGIIKTVAAQGGFFILDEIYQHLVHRPRDYCSGLELSDDIYVLNSFSKFFGMTGWRLGWVVVPQQAVAPITKLAQNLFICPSAPAQYAALAALEPEAMSIHAERRDIFADRAAALSQRLTALGFTIPVMPDGAFYLYVDVTHTGMDATEFCWRLMNEYAVAVTPGTDFGKVDADRYVRFAYTNDLASIDLGCARIAEALQAWGVAP
ncbi:MAG TPA: aminotransferase [Gammaproteobacteria bacterium]|jgi:aspartate/methionine/tyrosine aminotransferase|nr:aminotransferase [Gammaproteobacteria bacterium]|tara:strand:+ start:41088 stop:42257 length:1170 start_codon:yes stop_codon:yes gene_type:complete